MIIYLNSLHLLDYSIIIVTSDHGEMFGEHGKWLHHNSLYEEVLRVPLLIRYTGVISSGLVISTPVQTLDITPSLLDWIGLPIPANLHGRSLSALVQGEPITETWSVFSELDAITDPDLPGYWIASRYELRSIRRDDWKYIHQIGLTNADELYRLQPSSPYETNNLLETEPDIADRLSQELVNWFGIPTRHIYLPIARKESIR